MNFIKRILHAHSAAHSQVWFPWEETGSWIFRTLIQKVKFTTLPLFPTHILSLVTIPRKHGVWQSSCYTSWLNLKPSFLIFPRWCLKGLSAECLGKAAKGQSWWGEEILLPPSHLALENQCRSRESHLIPGIFKLWTEGLISHVEGGPKSFPKEDPAPRTRVHPCNKELFSPLAI